MGPRSSHHPAGTQGKRRGSDLTPWARTRDHDAVGAPRGFFPSSSARAGLSPLRGRAETRRGTPGPEGPPRPLDLRPGSLKGDVDSASGRTRARGGRPRPSAGHSGADNAASLARGPPGSRPPRPSSTPHALTSCDAVAVAVGGFVIAVGPAADSPSRVSRRGVEESQIEADGVVGKEDRGRGRDSPTDDSVTFVEGVLFFFFSA